MGSLTQAYAPYKSQISAAAKANGVPVGALASVLGYESAFSPTAQHKDSNGTVDQGISQLNSAYYSSSLAFNPTQAISQAATILRQHYANCGSWAGAISAYNLGHCGSNPSYLGGVNTVAAELGYSGFGSGSGTVATPYQESTTPAGIGTPKGSGTSPTWLTWVHQNAWILILPGALLLWLAAKEIL